MKQGVAAMLRKPLFFLLAFLLMPAFFEWFVPKVEAATLVYSNGFELGFGNIRRHGGCYPYSFAIVASPVRTGVNGLRVINKGWEDNQVCTDFAKGGKHRTEIRHGSADGSTDALVFKKKTPYWIGWSVFVPNNYPTDRTDAIIASQLIGCCGAGPETSLSIRGNRWNIVRAWNNGAGNKGSVSEFKSPVQKGRWTDWVIYFQRSWNDDGILKVWQDGTLVVNTVGRNAADYEVIGGGNG